MQWLRRRFLTGLFVTVPLVISVAALVWVFQVVDGFTAPLYARWLGRAVPGLGIVTTAMGVLLVGVIATNVIGRRVLQQGEQVLLRVPVFRTIYGPLKQLIAAFSPDSAQGFKGVVMADDPARGLVLGALAGQVMENAIALWGMAVANLVSLFNPERVILGGGVFGPAVRFIARIREEACLWAQPIGIGEVVMEPSQLGPDAALYGAGRLALLYAAGDARR